MKISLIAIAMLFSLSGVAQKQPPVTTCCNICIGKNAGAELTTQSFCIIICSGKATLKNDINPPHSFYYHVNYNSSFFQTCNGFLVRPYLKRFEKSKRTKNDFYNLHNDLSRVMSGNPKCKLSTI